jgi:hypothetical protein
MKIFLLKFGIYYNHKTQVLECANTYTCESLWPRINGYNLNSSFSIHLVIARLIAHKNFIISLYHHTLYIKFGLHIATCYQQRSTFFPLCFNNSSLFKSMSNLIWKSWTWKNTSWFVFSYRCWCMQKKNDIVIRMKIIIYKFGDS